MHESFTHIYHREVYLKDKLELRIFLNKETIQITTRLLIKILLKCVYFYQNPLKNYVHLSLSFNVSSNV